MLQFRQCLIQSSASEIEYLSPFQGRCIESLGSDSMAQVGRAGRVPVGPERFFYDKSTYTGTHSNGGPERVAKGGGSSVDQSWKRPSIDSTGDSAAGSGRPARAAVGPERFFYDKSTYTGTHINGGPERVAKGGGSSVDQSWKRSSIDSTEDAAVGSGKPSRVPVGPERFFYDKSTYTGTHVNGGPERVAKGGGSSIDQTWKRPSIDSAEDKDHLARVTLLSQGQGARPPSPLRSGEKVSTPRLANPSRPSSRGRPGSKGPGTGRLTGPERFFYDKSTYTGTFVKVG